MIVAVQWSTIAVVFHGSGCRRWMGRVDGDLHFLLRWWWGLLGYLRLTFMFSTNSPSVCETSGLRATGTFLFVVKDREIQRFFFL